MPNFLDGVLGGTGGSADFEPQRTNNALLHINLGGVGPLGDNDLVLGLMSFPIPKVSNGTIEIGYINEKRKFAGNPVFEDLTVVYKDYVNHQIADTLLAWRHQVYNPHTGANGIKSVYAKTGFVQLFAPNGTFERHYDMFGMWPSNFDPGDVDMTGEDSQNITLTLVIDKAKPGKNFTTAVANTVGAAGSAGAGAAGAPVGTA